jgi:tetratricopeptide (TPR) repeat protein
VSLLMDALKKAEQAKRGGRLDVAVPGATDSPVGAADGNDAAAMQSPQPADRSPAPETAVSLAPASLPDLPLKLEELDDEFVTETPRKPSPARRPPAADSGARTEAAPAAAPASRPPPVVKAAQSSTAEAANRVAAQNAFAAKEALVGGKSSFGVVVGAITLLAVAGIGVYFWLQLKPSPALSGAQPAAALNPAATAPAAGLNPAPPRTLLPAPGAMHPGAEPARDRPAAVARSVEARATPSAAAAYSPIRITTSRPTLNPTLAEAYDAFQAGNLPKARADYERVLQTDPRNADALHGAAAVALREGRGTEAQTYYLRLLDADPRDAVAQAGLVGLNAQGDPVSSETRLKTLLASQPDAPALHFALGNLLARQGRWNEAQQAFFNAVTADGDNPDYLFNLAVSLDQLHQTKPAAQYYRQALTAAAARPAAFDQARVAGRLRDLQPQ